MNLCHLVLFGLSIEQRESQLNLRVQLKGKTEQVWSSSLQGGVFIALPPSLDVQP